MSSLHIPLLLGTAREGRQSEKAAIYMLEQIKKAGIETELVDVRNFLFGKTLAAWENPKEADPWRAIIKKSQALIIVTPEYNHSFPGELKMLLDSLLPEYAGLPVGVCGVSSGGFGGARVIENILPTLRKMGMVAISKSLNFSKIEEFFDDNGNPKNQSFEKQVKEFLAQLAEYAQKLKA